MQLRWASQVNEEVVLLWYNKWFQIFQKQLLEYVANNFQTQTLFANIVKDQDEYQLPFSTSSQRSGSSSYNLQDFYSVIQLRVACDKKDDQLVYRNCRPISLTDYNIKSKDWKTTYESPYLLRDISDMNTRYIVLNRDTIKIFPKPTENFTNWLSLSFNYWQWPLTLNTNEDDINLPRYFLDVIDDYLTFRLMQAENPELSEQAYSIFTQTLHDNIYWLNRDQRPVEEEFANLYYFDRF